MYLADHILNNLPCGCIVFESDGKISFVNPAICEILGYPSELLLNSKLEKVLTISSRIFYQTHFFPLLKLQGQVSEIFLTLKPGKGSPVPVMVNVKSNQHDGLTSYIGTFSPVWERQKYEQELILAKKAQEKALLENDLLMELKGKLELNQRQLDSKLSLLMELSKEYMQIGKVLTHDMQEPIRKIAFSFQALLEQKTIQLGGNDLKKIDIINNSLSRLRSLTNSLLDFVNMSSINEDHVFLDAGKLIQEAEIEMKQFVDFDNVTVQIGNIPGFFARLTQIKRVFTELLKNAVQNRQKGQPLIIRISAATIKHNSYKIDAGKYNYTDHIRIEFSDNGIGFDSQFETYVFGLSNKLNNHSDGVGLGLTLCKHIISQHNGSIKIDPNPGVGTKVILVLPIKQS